MKTKDYVEKYELNINDTFNHSDFVADLTNEFMSLLEFNKADDNIKGFDNAVRAIRMKWDAINNKTVGQLPDKLWRYFFAAVIVKLKESLCPKDVARRKEQQEAKKRYYEEQKRMNDSYYDSFADEFFRQRFNFLQSILKTSRKPIEQFKKLGFAVDIVDLDCVTIDDVNKSYRKLTLTHHPDKGGKQEDFIAITEAKNKCIQWLTSNQS